MSPSAPLSLPTRPPAALGVLALHAVLLALVLQADLLQRTLPEAVPVAVSLLTLPAPVPAPAPPPAAQWPAPARATAPQWPWLPPPQVEVPQTPSVPASPPAPEPAPGVETAQAVAAVAIPTPTAPTAPPSPTAPPAPPAPRAEPRQLPPGAIGYRVPPAIAVPLASRRLRESGTVWLRVRVDRQGLPVQVSVHRSSGYPRLDEQALAAMQAARFVPQTENGMPIDWVVIAPLAYDID